MAISDVLITKPGAATMFEAIAMQLPLLIDNTSTALGWEVPHIEFIKENNLGIILKRYKDLK